MKLLLSLVGLVVALLPFTPMQAVKWRGDHPALALGLFIFGAIFFLVFSMMASEDRGFGQRYRSWLSFGAMTLLALFLMAPFVWMVLVSLHPSKAPIPELNNLVPAKPAWENYRIVVFNEFAPVGRFFLNTLFVTVVVVVLQLLVTSMAAYSFARTRFRGREALFTLFLLSMMFAGPVTQIPVYLMVRSVGWLDTYWALIVPSIGSAFSVFLLRQFFMAIPKELDEAAKLDGASDWRVYSRVILPLSRTALATAAAFTFIAMWMDFFWPLIAMSSLNKFTLEVGLSFFKNSYGASNWPLSMTAAVIVMAPLLLVFLMAQRHFIKGITVGSIK